MNLTHGKVGSLTWDACDECEYGQDEESVCTAPRGLVFLEGWGDACECDQFREAT